MGWQVIKQPDGLLAVRSSETDTLIAWDATRDEVLELFADRAAARLRRDLELIGETVDHVLADEPRKAYYQFAVTWERAVADDREHGGEYSAATPKEPRQ